MKSIFILDEKENPVAILNPELPEACPFYDDLLTRRLEYGYMTFEFEVPGNHPIVEKISAGGYLIYPYTKDGNPYYFRILTPTDKDKDNGYRKKFFCENAAVDDLIGNPIRPATLNSYSLEQAMNYVLSGSEWSAGEVEFAGLRDIQFTDYMSSLEALHKVLDAFGAEIEFSVRFDGLRVVEKRVSALIQRGKVTKKPFVYSRDLQDVERTEDTSNLVTAMIGVGKSNSTGQFLTIANFTPSGLDTSKYEKAHADDWVGSLEAFQRWGKNGRHVFGIHRDNTATNQVELFNNTLSALDKYSKPQYTYRVGVVLLADLLGIEAHEVDLGDTVIVKDTTLQPELVLDARIIESKKSIRDPSKNEVTLGEFVPVIYTNMDRIEEIRRTIDANKGVWDNAAHTGASFHIIANGPKPLVDGDYGNYDHSLYIEVTEDVHLGNVSIYAETAGISGVVELRDSNENVLETRNVVLENAGENRINLDLLLKKETGSYRLYGNFEDNTWRTKQGLSYPYDSGSFKVTGSSSASGYWYHFYSIEITGVGVTGAYGRELMLGNTDNRYGTVTLLNQQGEAVISIDNQSIGMNKLIAGEVQAPNVATVQTQGVSYYVDSINGSDENNGLTPDTPFATMQAAIDSLPRFLDEGANIFINSDVTENINIAGFLGKGVLTINCYPYRITGTVIIDSCKIRIDFLNADFYRIEGETTAIVRVHKTDYIYFYRCRFFGKRDTTTPANGNSATLAVYDNSFAYLYQCELYGANRENIRSSYGARAVVFDCMGSNSSYGVYAEYAGLIGIRGYVPNATTPSGSGYGGQVVYSGQLTGQNGTPPASIPSVTIETKYNSIADSWRDGYNNWLDDGTVRQGQFEGSGLYSGVWLWRLEDINTIVGKNISRIRAYLTRKAEGGEPDKQTVYIRWHGYDSNTGISNKPILSADYVIAASQWGESKWVELPQSFIDAFQAGTAKGIGIYSENGDYMIFSDIAGLEFTYSS